VDCAGAARLGLGGCWWLLGAENFGHWMTENFSSERLANASGTLRLPYCGLWWLAAVHA
jgi:hypothetical protein